MLPVVVLILVLVLGIAIVLVVVVYCVRVASREKVQGSKRMVFSEESEAKDLKNIRPIVVDGLDSSGQKTPGK